MGRGRERGRGRRVCVCVCVWCERERVGGQSGWGEREDGGGEPK